MSAFHSRLHSAPCGCGSRSALDLFSENPFWAVGALVERLKVAFTMAQSAVNWFEALGGISRIGNERRDRVYCAQGIFDVLEELS